jgi:hypothetical protein
MVSVSLGWLSVNEPLLEAHDAARAALMMIDAERYFMMR